MLYGTECWACLLEIIADQPMFSIQGRATDDYFPFFVGDFPDETEIQNKCVRSESSSHEESVMGVPTHYQTDGSYLYLLTPATSPPSAEKVNRWLSSDEKDDVPPTLPQGPQENHENHEERNHFCTDRTGIGQREGDAVKFQLNSECAQDNSQISGPDGRSKPTPLKSNWIQGPCKCWRRPTADIVKHRESRGDLQPDPRFDVIDFISLAIQNDSDPIVEVHVLLLSKAEGSQRCYFFYEEKYLFDHFTKIVCSLDPDVLMERASHLGIGLLNKISRAPSESKMEAEDLEILEKAIQDKIIPEAVIANSVVREDPVIEDEWGRTHASGVHVCGRIILNIWWLICGEVKLNMYTVEAVALAVLRRKVPYISNKVLAKWFSSGPGQARYRCIEYVNERAKLSLEIMNQLDMINRTSELAHVFGSQYCVESMFLRLAHAQNYVAISPGSKQVASQPAMEYLPLVMEPESGLYSLYPSMIIAYNLCYSTLSSFSPDPHDLHILKDQILLTPNGVMYVPKKVRKGVLPRLLDEILSTRIMVKQAMKKLSASQQVLHSIFNATQLALKLISNVYGYTAAGFSGRMPCAEIADIIVQCGRSTLEKAISYVNAHDKWKEKVIYGDTDRYQSISYDELDENYNQFFLIMHHDTS
ncbi:unnamed protein product [Malus baccata var. baccata]